MTEGIFDKYVATTEAARAVQQKLMGDGAESRQRMSEVISWVCSMVIEDQLDYPSTLVLESPATEDPQKRVFLTYPDKKRVAVHPHALRQICAMAEFPVTYLNKLLNDCAGMPIQTRYEILSYCVNRHFQEGVYGTSKRQSRVLSRIVAGQLRGFLSDRYSLLLPTVPLLRSFVEAVQRLGGFPYDSIVDDTRMLLRAALPYVVEPVPGEYLGFGYGFANSDFGAGRMKVTSLLLRPTTKSILSGFDNISKVHLGRIVDDATIQLSNTTIQDGVRASQGVVTDAVNQMWTSSRIETAIQQVQEAMERKVSWKDVQKVLGGQLTKQELERLKQLADPTISQSLRLPPIDVQSDRDALLSGWWVSSALGAMADKEDATDRRELLQELAGSFLTGEA